VAAAGATSDAGFLWKFSYSDGRLHHLFVVVEAAGVEPCRTI